MNNFKLTENQLYTLLAEAVQRGIHKKAPAKGFLAKHTYKRLGQVVLSNEAKDESKEILQQFKLLCHPDKPKMEIVNPSGVPIKHEIGDGC